MKGIFTPQYFTSYCSINCPFHNSLHLSTFFWTPTLKLCIFFTPSLPRHQLKITLTLNWKPLELIRDWLIDWSEWTDYSEIEWLIDLMIYWLIDWSGGRRGGSGYCCSPLQGRWDDVCGGQGRRYSQSSKHLSLVWLFSCLVWLFICVIIHLFNCSFVWSLTITLVRSF